MTTDGLFAPPGSAFVEEARFLRWLASRHSWAFAMAYRGLYTLQLPNAPLYKEWVREGKPEVGKPFGEEGLAAEARGRFEAGRTAEEEKFGIQFNEPYEGAVTLPDGTVTSISYWMGLSEQRKADLATGGMTVDKERGIVTLPTGETKSLAWWESLSPEQQAKYRQAPTADEDQPSWTIDWRGKTYTPDEWRIYTETVFPIEQWQAGQRGTPYQQARLDLAREQFEFQKAQAEREDWLRSENLKAAQANLMTRRLTNLISPPDIEGQRAELQRRENAMLFNQIKQDFLESVRGQPRQYIKEWRARNIPNPFAPQEETYEEALNKAQESLKTLKDKKKEILADLKDPDDPLTMQAIIDPNTVVDQSGRLIEPLHTRAMGASTVFSAIEGLKNQIASLEASEEGQYAEKWGVPRPDPGGGFLLGPPAQPEEPQPVLPELPPELSEFFPEYNRYTEGVGELTPPSAQALSRLDYTGREKLFGTMEYAGGQPADLLRRIEMTLPEPTIKGGWQSFLQRT